MLRTIYILLILTPVWLAITKQNSRLKAIPDCNKGLADPVSRPWHGCRSSRHGQVRSDHYTWRALQMAMSSGAADCPKQSSAGPIRPSPSHYLVASSNRYRLRSLMNCPSADVGSAAAIRLLASSTGNHRCCSSSSTSSSVKLGRPASSTRSAQ